VSRNNSYVCEPLSAPSTFLVRIPALLLTFEYLYPDLGDLAREPVRPTIWTTLPELSLKRPACSCLGASKFVSSWVTWSRICCPSPDSRRLRRLSTRRCQSAGPSWSLLGTKDIGESSSRRTGAAGERRPLEAERPRQSLTSFARPLSTAFVVSLVPFRTLPVLEACLRTSYAASDTSFGVSNFTNRVSGSSLQYIAHNGIFGGAYKWSVLDACWSFSAGQRPLLREESPLPGKPQPVPSQASVLPYHPVARYDEGDRVRPAGVATARDGRRSPIIGCDLAVGTRRADGDLLKSRPYLQLKVRPAYVQRQFHLLAAQVGVDSSEEARRFW